jgi:hypothetical protein
VRLIARSCLIGFLIAGLLNLPVLAANAPNAANGEKALGVIIQSQIGRLGNSNVTIGTSVYPGDSLWTDVGGTLRMKIGAGQMYLLSSSAMTLGQDNGFVLGTLTRGVGGFSATAADRIGILLNEGILRPADGQPAYGQVQIIDPNEVIISSYRGSLILDNAGEIHTIEAGKAYRVVILPDDAQKPEGAATQEYPETKMKYPKRRHLALTILLLSIAGIGSYFIYDELTESPSKFN